MQTHLFLLRRASLARRDFWCCRSNEIVGIREASSQHMNNTCLATVLIEALTRNEILMKERINDLESGLGNSKLFQPRDCTG